MWIDETRPLSRSGVASWTIELRRTALITSAAPAMARQNRASGKLAVSRPKAAIAAPHAATDTTTPRPGRRTRPIQPLNAAPTKAPTAGAAFRSETHRAGVEYGQGKLREERARHAEDHGVEVDGKGGQDDPPVHSEAQALTDRLQAGPGGSGVGRDRGYQEKRCQTGHKGGHVQGEGRGHTGHGDENASEDGPGNGNGLAAEPADGDGCRQALARYEAR